MHLRHVTILLPLLFTCSVAMPQGLEREQDLGPRAPLGVKPERTLVSPVHDTSLLFLKFAHGSQVRLSAGRLFTQGLSSGEVESLSDKSGHLSNDAHQPIRRRGFSTRLGLVNALVPQINCVPNRGRLKTCAYGRL